jgi:hypothetical protein
MPSNKQCGKATTADTAALADTRTHQNLALDAGSRPAMPGQTYEPPVQHLAAFSRPFWPAVLS